jgi:hypothetical protein
MHQSHLQLAYCADLRAWVPGISSASNALHMFTRFMSRRRAICFGTRNTAASSDQRNLCHVVSGTHRKVFGSRWGMPCCGTHDASLHQSQQRVLSQIAQRAGSPVLSDSVCAMKAKGITPTSAIISPVCLCMSTAMSPSRCRRSAPVWSHMLP